MQTYTELLKYKLAVKGLNKLGSNEVIDLAKTDPAFNDISDIWDKPATAVEDSVLWIVVEELADEYQAVFSN